MTYLTKKYLFFFILLITILNLNGCTFNLNKLKKVTVTQSFTVIDSQLYNRDDLNSYSFFPYANNVINFNEFENKVIFKINLENNNQQDEDYVLVIDYKYLDKVSYFSELNSGELSQVQDSSRLKSAAQQIFSTEKYVFNINVHAKHHYVVIDNHKDSIVMIKVVKKNDYIGFDRNIGNFFTLVYASLLGLFLINFIYYIFIKKLTYLYYSAYILFGLIATYLMEGRLIEVPFVSNLMLGRTTCLFVFLLSHIFLYIFVYNFLQLNWKKHIYGKAILIWIAYIVIMLVLLAVFSYIDDRLLYSFSNGYHYTIHLGSLMILWISFKGYKNGNRQAGFLLVSFAFFIVFSSLKTLFIFNPEPNQFWMQHSYEFGLLFQSFILSLGLAEQALSYKKSYDGAEKEILKTNEALFAETLIVNFGYELKDEILKESKIENFIKHIENKFVNMLMKYAPIDHVNRLRIRNDKCRLYTLSEQNNSDNFKNFWSTYENSIIHSCQQRKIFSQVIKSINDTNVVHFLALPIRLDYNNDNIDFEYLICEIKPNYILGHEKIAQLQQFINKSLKVLVDSKEIKKMTRHAKRVISIAEEKEKIMRMKDRFFANVSHEFRTPLTLTIAPLKDLHQQREFLNTSGKYLVNTALSNALDLMGLVDRLLDIQKLETDTFPLSISKVNLNKLIYSIINQLTNWSLDHYQTLKFIKNNTNDVYVYCDIKEVKKVITNLISNAIKYSGQYCEINISIDQNPDWVQVHIKDNGVGIDQDIQELIFERYYQGHSQQHLLEAGTGIGLAYVKDMMELHHGSVNLSSEINKGSQFTLCFKQGFHHYNYDEIVSSEEKSVLKDKGAAIKFEQTISLNNPQNIDEMPSVLIVEDNNELRHFLEYKFKEIYKVYVASNGRDGLEKTRFIIPDIIISDVMMPEMDGIEMMKLIRETKELATIPIILLTAKSGQEDKIEGLQTGADHYLVKPFDFDELLARVERLIVARKTLIDYSEHLIKGDAGSIKTEFQEKLDAIIFAHIADKQLNVEKLSDMMFLDRSTLYRKIKNSFDMTPVAYIRKVRMDFALNLLKNKKLTVSETAYACGFESLSYFSKQFKKTHGTSPSDVL